MKRTIAAFCVAASMATAALAADRVKSVTLTGCVRNGGESNTFVLTKVEGADAPKARGWKTGYLLKRRSDIDVVPAAKSVRLKDHVGRKVRVSGTLEEKQLKARSVRVLASCQQ